MAITGKKTEITEQGERKEALSVSFTNGALEQLETLRRFLGSDDPIEVVKVGIAFVQRLKEEEDAERNKEPK